jgi:hypothetical protein
MLKLTDRDRLTIHPQGARWVVRLQLGTAVRPYSQPDDLDAPLTHYALFPTRRDAEELLRRIVWAGAVDERHWLWTPREAGRFGGEPVARAEAVGSFTTYRHA